MDFIVVRLGKDSVGDLEKIDSSKLDSFEPFVLEFTCKQVEQSIQPGAYSFIYLGSDNNKGVATDWKQGLRALGTVRAKKGGENFQADCTLSIEVFSIFPKSLDQYDFLESCPLLYVHFAAYPIIGVRSSRNNAVQKVNEGQRESSSALLTALGTMNKEFSDQLKKYAPQLLALLGFVPKVDMTEGKAGGEQNGDVGKILGGNTIFYGAPGTGKSYAINKTVKEANTFTTVFHPESLNSEFVGTLKPIMVSDGDGVKKLSYDYVPGPFLKALIAAVNNPEEHYWLVIEELNRAPATTVFGEIFQLLDRNPDGSSAYSIDFTDTLSMNYVNSQLKKEIKRLYLPSNLSLLASMNSSDQGVLPLDTAFKRRWKFVYIPLDFDKGCTDGTLEIVLEDGVTRTFTWQNFAQSVNVILSNASIPEDRHLGPYFLSAQDLVDTEFILTGKLFLYLWDDVLRHGLRSRLFDPSVKTYGSLVSRWDNKLKIFSDEFLQLLGEPQPKNVAVSLAEN